MYIVASQFHQYGLSQSYILVLDFLFSQYRLVQLLCYIYFISYCAVKFLYISFPPQCQQCLNFFSPGASSGLLNTCCNTHNIFVIFFFHFQPAADYLQLITLCTLCALKPHTNFNSLVSYLGMQVLACT